MTWFLTDAADAWMPNVATSAAVVAITITVIDRAVHREARRRAEPRFRRVYQDIRDALEFFGWQVANEYSDIHDAAYRPIQSAKLTEILWHWRAFASQADLDPSEERIVPAGERLATQLDKEREKNIDILGSEAGFFVAMDECARELRSAATVITFTRALETLPDPTLERFRNQARAKGDVYVRMAEKVVEAVAAFTALFERQSGEPVLLNATIVDAVNVLHEREMEVRGRRAPEAGAD